MKNRIDMGDDRTWEVNMDRGIIQEKLQFYRKGHENTRKEQCGAVGAGQVDLSPYNMLNQWSGAPMYLTMHP